MFPIHRYAETEIRPGMAFFLSPVELREQMAKTIQDALDLRPIGFDNHYFLVLERRGDFVAVTPLTSHPRGDGWAKVGGKYGHPGWVDQPTYFHPRELWPVTVSSVVAAARVGGDLSNRHSRNVVAGKDRDQIVQAMIGWWKGEGLLPRGLDKAWIERRLWQVFWARYRTGEIWRELRLSSVFFQPRRVRFATGRT